MNGVQGSIGGLCLLSLVSALSLPAARQQAPAGTNWPSFRGPNASGVADGRPLPAEWDVPAFGRVSGRHPFPARDTRARSSGATGCSCPPPSAA
jgi:hypothetical protein